MACVWCSQPPVAYALSTAADRTSLLSPAVAVSHPAGWLILQRPVHSACALLTPCVDNALQGGQTAAARDAKREALALRKAAAVEEQQRRCVAVPTCRLS